MNRFLKSLFYAGILVALIMGFTIPAMGQTINVTFRVNTATNLDTLNENHFVQMRGAVNGAEGTIPGSGLDISWGSTSDLIMNNEGGDYWSFSFQMEPGDTLVYKFWTGFDPNTGTFPDNGWEGPFVPADPISIDTRTFISPANDTIVPVQFYHPAGSTVPQFWRPYELKADSIAIYFRVNMGGYIEQGFFDPATTDTVGVRGGPPVGNTSWDATTVLLSRENGSVNDSSFWSGVAYVDKDSVNINDMQLYKFVFENDGNVSWEGNIGNREFTFTSNLVNNTMDTTLHWSYFDSLAYTGQVPVTALLTFRVSTEAVEGLNLFDRGIGDKIYVIGPNGWDIPGDLIQMNFIPALQEWTAVEQFTRVPGTDISYKYFVRWDSSRVDSTSPNYIPNLKMRGINDPDQDSGWEEPSITGGSDRRYTWTSDPQQVPEGDWGFARQFFNAAPANCFWTTPLDITFNVDMTPATDPGQNTNPHLFVPGVDSVWIQFDGSLFALSQGWPTFDHRAILLEDPDQDMVYSATYSVTPPGWYQLGFILAYSTDTPGSYVTNGGGTAAGRRYYQFVWPDELLPNPGGQFPISVWPSSFNLPTIAWVQSNLPFEDPPDMTTPSGIEDGIGNVALTYELEQNYPNPFNPSTTIRYQIARASDVNISIYNIRGQLVKTLVDAPQNTGSYTILWNGNNDAGVKVASGVYFMKMKAGEFSQSRKMILIK